MVDRTTPKYQAINAKAQRVMRKNRRQWLHELKKTLSCVYCGEDNPLVIDFDHIDRATKVQTPATMVTGGYAWESVVAEINKCQPVCANCHRIKSIIEAGKMQGCDIKEYIPENMKHLCTNLISE